VRAELNWRRAYHDALEQELEQLKAWRRDRDNCPPTQRRQYLPGLQRSRSIFDCSDEQLGAIARYTAEVSVNEAIHKHGHERQLEDGLAA
jgi:hypothetical protein